MNTETFPSQEPQRTPEDEATLIAENLMYFDVDQQNKIILTVKQIVYDLREARIKALINDAEFLTELNKAIR